MCACFSKKCVWRATEERKIPSNRITAFSLLSSCFFFILVYSYIFATGTHRHLIALPYECENEMECCKFSIIQSKCHSKLKLKMDTSSVYLLLRLFSWFLGTKRCIIHIIITLNSKNYSCFVGLFSNWMWAWRGGPIFNIPDSSESSLLTMATLTHHTR